ncbi:hypothetical protein D4R42_01715, partial [bacterium]
TIEKEQWNKYRVSDGSELKPRFVLQQVITDKSMDEFEKELKAKKPDEPIVLGFVFKANRLFSIDTPVNLRGHPDSNKYRAEELRESILDEDIDFDTVNSSWNIYHLKNGMTFKCRLLVQTINRTNKFDDLGLAIYFIESNVDLKVTLPPKLEKIIKKKTKVSKRN